MPRDGANRRRPLSEAKPIDWTKYEHGVSGQLNEIPNECVAKPDTGSADDMWIRTQVIKPPIPEEPTGNPDAKPAAPDPSIYDMYGYGG